MKVWKLFEVGGDVGYLLVLLGFVNFELDRVYFKIVGVFDDEFVLFWLSYGSY